MFNIITFKLFILFIIYIDELLEKKNPTTKQRRAKSNMKKKEIAYSASALQ